MAMGIALGIGSVVAVGGIVGGVMLLKKMNADRVTMTQVNLPSGSAFAEQPIMAVVGRPYPDPYYNYVGTGHVWGGGPWAHRVPRMRPVAPHPFGGRGRS
jgi:hypothetical protein